MAAIFFVAGPAVGAPDIGRSVVEQMRLAICIVAGDICSDAMAARPGSRRAR